MQSRKPAKTPISPNDESDRLGKLIQSPAIDETQNTKKPTLSMAATRFHSRFASEESVQWHIQVMELTISRKTYKSCFRADYELVRNNESGKYFIHENGKSLASANANMQLLPRTIRKAWFAEDGGYVRFESENDGIANVMDLQLFSVRDLRTLLQKLRSEHKFAAVMKHKQVLPCFP